MMNSLHLFLNFFNVKQRRKSTPKLQKFLYSSSNFRMSDIDEYEDVDVSLWDDDEDFPVADQTDK